MIIMQYIVRTIRLTVMQKNAIGYNWWIHRKSNDMHKCGRRMTW